MRKTMAILLTSVLWLSVAGPVLADGMLLPLPGAASPDYLVVRYHHVTVTIEDGHAVTRVEQEFYNPYDVPVAGRYLFPIPPEALLSSFQATVDGQPKQAARQNAAATNAELHAMVTRQRDPSLLQYADWESLAFDLDLPPGGSKAMSLAYEELLVPSAGLYRYHYVLSTERYSSLPLDEVSVTVDLRSSSGLASLYAPNHAVDVEQMAEGQARVIWTDRNVNPWEDFELYFAPAERGFGGSLLIGEHDDGYPEGGDHFLSLFSPEIQPQPADSLPKDIVFVVDRSGSMSGEKIEQARNALHYILGQLGGDDRFSIIGFDDRLSVWNYALQPVDKRTVEDGRRFVDRLSADGSTDLETALQTALEILLGTGPRGATRMVVFLTDGLPTAGITDPARIAEEVARTNAALEARLHVFGVGYDVNTHLLDRLAADHGGTVTYVQPGENLEAALTEFYGKIAQPLLTDVEVEFEGMDVSDLYPAAIPDLFHGSSLLLTGRYRAMGNTVSLRVRGWANNEQREYVYQFDLAETTRRDFVPRLWATRRVGALLDQVRVEGETEALADEIRDLGLSYGIVTPYTAFVVAAQAEGAASADNMALYNSAELNQASGRVTVGARVQNQMYQETSQANLASGANVSNYGQHSLAQIGDQQVDLALLQNEEDLGLNTSITEDWIERNLDVDRIIVFGSEAYFALAADPEIRPFLQSGPSVVFAYKGEIIAIRDSDGQTSGTEDPSLGTQVPASSSSTKRNEAGTSPRASSPALYAVIGLLRLLIRLLPLLLIAGLMGFAALALAIRYAMASRVR